MSATTSLEVEIQGQAPNSLLAEFELVYRANVGALTAYFARRCPDPQTVADLTSETIVRAASGFRGFDPRRGAPRPWLFGIARNVYAAYCEQSSNGRDVVLRLAALADLPVDEHEELAQRIDTQRAGRDLLERWAKLPALERSAVELVEIDGLSPKEAAAALGVPRGVFRMRLSRGRMRLRKEHLE